MVKKVEEIGLVQAEIDYIHSPFRPEEVRVGDGIKAFLEVDGDWCERRVWNYSPYGVEIVKTKDIQIKKGDPVALKIKVGRDESIYTGLVVNEEYEVQNLKILGIRVFKATETRAVENDRRKSRRWNCPIEYLPTGSAPHPAKYNDLIFFRVSDVSVGGMQILTSMRNKLVAEGSRLEATLSLPMIGSVTAKLKVLNISVRMDPKLQKEIMVLRTAFINPSEDLTRSLSEYLLNFADGVSVKTLQEEGYKISKTTQLLDFSYVKNKAQYEQVLELRKLAYSSVGKIEEDIDSAEMADEYDARARILTVKHQDRIVGSVRLMFHNDYDETDHARYVSYPDSLPSITKVAEASRLCVDPSQRGSDIGYELLNHMFLTSLKSDRRYVLSGAAKKEMKFYEKVGWRKTGITYQNEALGGVEHELMLLDVYDVALGNGIKPKVWNKVYGNLVNFLLDNELVSPTPIQIAKINIYKMIKF